MKVGDKTLVVVGDRVLLSVEDGESLTDAGLILPATVADRDNVQTGRVVAVGPGHAIAPATFGLDEHPDSRIEPRHVAMQARPGDLAIFQRKAALEITLGGDSHVVVPHSAILVLLREELDVGRGGVPVN